MLRQHEQPPAAGWPGCEVGDCACAAAGAGRPHIPPMVGAAVVAAPADGVAAASCVMPHASAGVAVKAAAAAKLIASFLIVSFLGWLLFHGSSIHEALDEEGSLGPFKRASAAAPGADPRQTRRMSTRRSRKRAVGARPTGSRQAPGLTSIGAGNRTGQAESLHRRRPALASPPHGRACRHSSRQPGPAPAETRTEQR